MSDHGPHRRILVTGGSGFLGGHLVALLQSEGHEVRVLDVEPPRQPVPDVDYVRGSVCDRGVVRECTAGVSWVFHLAGIPHLWTADRGNYIVVNVEGARNVCAAALEAGVERLVHTSTALIAEGQPVESLAHRPSGAIAARLQTLPGDYCQSKFLAEQVVVDAVARGLDAIVVRPAALIGPGDHRLTPPTRLLLHLLNGKLPAYLETTLQFVDARDAAAGHLAAAQQGQTGSAYLLVSDSIALGNLLALLHHETGLPMPRRTVPNWLALAISRVEEYLAGRGLRGEPLSSVEGVRIAAAANPSPPEFVDPFGLSYRPLKETLGDTFDCFEQRGLLKPHAARAVRALRRDPSPVAASVP